MGSDQVRLLSEMEMPEAVKVFAEAFINDRLWLYAIPDDRKRREVLTLLFKLYVSLSFENRKLYGVGQPVKGAAIWTIPEQTKPGFFKTVRALLKSGGLNILFRPEFFSLQKMRSILKEVDRMHKQYAPQKHYYLDTLAVSPEQWHQGLASKLVKPFLEKAEKESTSVYLETMTEKNVAMYEHFGFKNMERVDFKKERLSVWALYKSDNKEGA